MASLVITYLTCFKVLLLSNWVQQSISSEVNHFAYPAKLFILSCMMLHMWFVSMFLCGQPVFDSPFQLFVNHLRSRTARKPPDKGLLVLNNYTSNSSKNLKHLALVAALGLAQSLPSFSHAHELSFQQ